MKIFLTGASGFLGKNFLKEAVLRGHKIYAPSRKKRYSKSIKWLNGDFDLNWNKQLKKSDILVHLASAGVNDNNIKNIYETNFFKSLRLIKNAIKNNCKKWLIISSSSEYGVKSKKMIKISTTFNRTPKTDYGMSKALFTDLCEKLAKENKCQCRVIRVFPFHGKNENIKRLFPSLKSSINRGKNFKIENPDEVRSFSNVKRIVEILLDSMNFNKKKIQKFSDISCVGKSNSISLKFCYKNLE